MKYLKKLYRSLNEALEQHATDVINYTIPQSWNTFGFSNTKVLRNHEMILHPYAFYTHAIKEILATPDMSSECMKQEDWLKQSITYFMDMRTFSSWDHDRSGAIEERNMYQLSDNGTFLKAIILLPLLKRAGINTLILHNYLSLAKSSGKSDYADPYATINFRDINPILFDPIVSSMSLKQQMHAFIEACHHFGIHVMLNFAPAICAQHSSYVKDHPEWFYWIHSEDASTYHTPCAPVLPSGCLPSQQVCQIFYDSEDVLRHIAMFTHHPQFTDSFENIDNETLHKRIQKTYQCVVAPLIPDQINASTKPDETCTPLRFFEDLPSYRPKNIKIPYILCDTMRNDLFPKKKKMTSLWQEIKDVLSLWITEFHIDGVYLTKSYLLPDTLLKDMATHIHKGSKTTKILLENMEEEKYAYYKELGFDAISGNSAYQIHDVYNYSYHTFAYSLLNAPTQQFAASELLDTPRICAYEQGECLAHLLSIMNLFLPNTIPCFMGGQLSLEKQPQYLSVFADQEHLNILDKYDPRYRKQAMLDHYSYDYTRRDYHVLINQLEKAVAIRQKYSSAITDINHCTPLFFDTPKDMGIGFAYTLDDKALLVVCNTSIHDHSLLHIHTENVMWKLPFKLHSMRQIYSSLYPYVYDVELDERNCIPIEFAPGEVKCIELM